MINTSSEYQDYIINNREFLARVTITLADDTEIEVDTDSIMANGIVINDSTSEDGSLSVGCANMGTCEITLENFDAILNDINFRNARVRVEIGLQLSSSVEYLQKGIYTIEKTSRDGVSLTLHGLDNMYKFDVPYSDSIISYPTTIRNAIDRLCTYCGVVLATPTFYNSSLTVPKPKLSNSMSCRDILAHLTQLSGCFARINRFGQLEIKWYDMNVLNEVDLDGGIFDNGSPLYATGDTVDGGDFDYNETTNYDGGTFDNFNKYHNFVHIYSLEVENENIEVTGIKIDYVETELDESGAEKDVEKSVLYGTDDYALGFNDNVFIYTTSFAEQIATTVGNKLIGMMFRPLEISIVSDPSVECGDVGYANDISGTSYRAIISNMKYVIGGEHNISSDAETPLEMSLTESSPTTKLVKRNTEIIINEKNARELAIEELNRAIENSNGLYTTIQNDGSGGKIYLLHDKPLLSDSTIIWRMSAEVFSVSTDGGTTWNIGLEADGDIIAQRLYAIGIDATYINTGSLNADLITTGKIKASVLDASVINAMNIIASSVKSDWVYAGNINASQITAGNISGDRISGGTISGASLQSIGYGLGYLSKTLIDNGVIQTHAIKIRPMNATSLDFSNDSNGYTMLSPRQIAIWTSSNYAPFSVTDGAVQCTSINGGTPITSSNIGSQSVNYAITAGTATSATSAGTATNASYASYADSANSAGSADGLKGGVVYVSANNNLRPMFDGGSACGSSDGRWSSIWAVSGTVSTSDERLKRNISELENDERFIRFAKIVVPYTYQMVDGTSGRYHIGFIAQRIEDAMIECGISSMEFAGLIKAPIYSAKLENGEFDETSEIVDYSYHLRYDEFIPLLFLLDKLKDKEIETLTSRIERLEKLMGL